MRDPVIGAARGDGIKVEYGRCEYDIALRHWVPLSTESTRDEWRGVDQCDSGGYIDCCLVRHGDTDEWYVDVDLIAWLEVATQAQIDE